MDVRFFSETGFRCLKLERHCWSALYESLQFHRNKHDCLHKQMRSTKQLIGWSRFCRALFPMMWFSQQLLRTIDYGYPVGWPSASAPLCLTQWRSLWAYMYVGRWPEVTECSLITTDVILLKVNPIEWINFQPYAHILTKISSLYTKLIGFFFSFFVYSNRKKNNVL